MKDNCVRSKYDMPNEPEFTSLRGKKNRHLRIQFHSLCRAKQRLVQAKAKRYVKACKHEEVDLDPEFFKEVIIDIRDNSTWLKTV